ncbi:MAG: hypothetical protein AUI11_01015 [Acidobacteria bacterium 13_2_20CM_2_66_4]|nr:MAG: hypothetical protein AUI11_01015 [Acidobacteria bacterium 13_2_20CM_2_66_4]
MNADPFGGVATRRARSESDANTSHVGIVHGSCLHPIRPRMPARAAGRPPNGGALRLCVSVAKTLRAQRTLSR